MPIKRAEVTISSKRTDVYSYSGNSGTYTDYFITFEFKGKRFERKVPANIYGLLREDDRGTLVCQGTKFIDFIRKQTA